MGIKKTVERESGVYTNCNCFPWYNHQRTNKGMGGLGGWRTSGDHLNYWIIEISQNTVKSPGDLRRPIVSQT